MLLIYIIQSWKKVSTNCTTKEKNSYQLRDNYYVHILYLFYQQNLIIKISTLQIKNNIFHRKYNVVYKWKYNNKKVIVMLLCFKYGSSTQQHLVDSTEIVHNTNVRHILKKPCI